MISFTFIKVPPYLELIIFVQDSKALRSLKALGTVSVTVVPK